MKQLTTRQFLKQKAIEELKAWGQERDEYYESTIKSSRISTKKLKAIMVYTIGKERFDILDWVIMKQYDKVDRFLNNPDR